MKTAPFLDAIDLDEFERVVVLSPHLDDAVLSCGGLLSALKGRISCLVITIACSNPTPRPGGPGKAQRARNRAGFASPAERRREDIAAMQSIDCDFVHLGFSDCIYRRSPTSGDLIYKKPREILARGLPNIDDSAHVEELYLVLRRLCLGMGRLLLIGPMGIGHHIDHIICAHIVTRLKSERATVLFYEDFPYVIYGDDEYEKPLPRLRIEPDSPEEALTRIQHLPVRRLAMGFSIEDKARLLLHYKSQIEGLFGDEHEMRRMLAHRRHGGEPAEQFWIARHASAAGRRAPGGTP